MTNNNDAIIMASVCEADDMDLGYAAGIGYLRADDDGEYYVVCQNEAAGLPDVTGEAVAEADWDYGFAPVYDSADAAERLLALLGADDHTDPLPDGWRAVASGAPYGAECEVDWVADAGTVADAAQAAYTRLHPGQSLTVLDAAGSPAYRWTCTADNDCARVNL